MLTGLKATKPPEMKGDQPAVSGGRKNSFRAKSGRWGVSLIIPTSETPKKKKIDRKVETNLPRQSLKTGWNRGFTTLDGKVTEWEKQQNSGPGMRSRVTEGEQRNWREKQLGGKVNVRKKARGRVIEEICEHPDDKRV